MNDVTKDDHAAQPMPFFLSWGLPLIILISTNFLTGIVPFQAVVAIISGAFFWMGLACLLNARRCRRRHCFYSGPIFLLGGVAVLLVGFNVIPLGPDGLMTVVSATLVLALLSYLSEPIFGKYIR